MDQFISGLLQLFGYLAMVYAGFFLLERLVPAERHQPIRNALFNIALTPLLVILSTLLVMVLAPLIHPAINDPIGQRIKLHFPDGVMGSVLAVMTLYLATDLFYYWWHRFQHTNRWLWAQHTLHHTEHSRPYSQAHSIIAFIIRSFPNIATKILRGFFPSGTSFLARPTSRRKMSIHPPASKTWRRTVFSKLCSLLLLTG